MPTTSTRERDEARAQHWADYFRRMQGSEADQADRTEARRLYDAAYTAARIM